MYHKCIKLDSSAIPIIMNLGNAFIDIGEVDSAIAVHKFLISKEASNAGNYINLGDAYMKKEDIAQAQHCFENAIRLNNYSSLALVNLAMAYFNQKKYAEAIDKLFLVRNLDDWYPLLQNRLDMYLHLQNKNLKNGLKMSQTTAKRIITMPFRYGIQMNEVMP